jgi:hypothetical protein
MYGKPPGPFENEPGDTCASMPPQSQKATAQASKSGSRWQLREPGDFLVMTFDFGDRIRGRDINDPA